MSVALSFYNKHGITVCADRRIITCVNANENTKDSFVLTDSEQKLFSIMDKFALTFSGTASFRGVPTSFIICDYIDRFNLTSLTPSELILSLAKYIHGFHCNDNDNCVLILSGYHAGSPFIFSTGTQSPSVNTHIDQSVLSSLAYSGESNILDVFLKSDSVKYDYGNFTMQDAVDFLRFLVRTTSEWQRFQQGIQSVSPECDIICITPNNLCWVSCQSLH